MDDDQDAACDRERGALPAASGRRQDDARIAAEPDPMPVDDDAARLLPTALTAIRHVARLRAEVPDLRAERDAALRRLDAISGSRTWRLSAPVRRLAGWLGRISRAARPRRAVASPTDRLASVKAAFRDRCAAALDAFLASGARIALPAATDPRVSILLVLFNQAELTFHCLQSLAQDAGVEAEVILVDNGSTDRTAALLDRLDGARVIRAQENLHFLRGVNRAAQDARGRHLLLLNNDTRVDPGAIAAAAARLDADPGLGAVGGPILMLDGRLQEAGSIIWRDGTTTGYGRGEDPGGFAFGFRRDVDYCSGAFLMVRRDLFERLGRLDTAYAPAYYEEADMCMRIRAAGFRVGYEPACRIMHVEFGSALSAADAPRLSARNRGVFVARHAAVLAAGHHAPGTSPLIARMRGGAAGRILVLDARDWRPDAAAPHAAGLALSRFLTEQGFAVTFCMPRALREAAGHGAVPDTVECAMAMQPDDIPTLLRNRGGHYDAVLLLEADAGGLAAGTLAAIDSALDGALLLRLPAGEARR